MLIFDFLIDMVGYAVARVALPLISVGFVRVEPLDAPLSRFNRFGLRRDEERKIELESTMAGFIGFIILLIVLAVGGLAIRAASGI